MFFAHSINMSNPQQNQIQNEIKRIRKEINLLKEKKQQRKFPNELKNVKKRRNKLKQIVKKKIFSLAEKTQILSRNIEQFKKEKNLLNNIEQIKKNKKSTAK